MILGSKPRKCSRATERKPGEIFLLFVERGSKRLQCWQEESPSLLRSRFYHFSLQHAAEDAFDVLSYPCADHKRPPYPRSEFNRKPMLTCRGARTTKCFDTKATKAAVSSQVDIHPSETRTKPVGRPSMRSCSSQHTCPLTVHDVIDTDSGSVQGRQ